MPPPIPRCSSRAKSSLNPPSHFSLPRYGSRVGLHIVLFEACSAFTRVAACTLALSPIRDTLIEGFGHFVTSMTAPIASGWSDCRVGLAPTGKRRLCTAHANSGPSQTRRLRRGHSKVPISVHPRRAGWGDVRIHARVRSAGAAAARAATAFSDGSRQPGGHGWIWRIPQRFLPLQPKRPTVLLLLLRASSQSTSEAVLNLRACTHEPTAQSGRIVAFKPRAVWNDHERCSLICLCGKEAEA